MDALKATPLLHSSMTTNIKTVPRVGTLYLVTQIDPIYNCCSVNYSITLRYLPRDYKYIVLQWNLFTTDKLVHEVLSIIQRCPLLRGFIIIVFI